MSAGVKLPGKFPIESHIPTHAVHLVEMRRQITKNRDVNDASYPSSMVYLLLCSPHWPTCGKIDLAWNGLVMALWYRARLRPPLGNVYYW